MILAEFVKKVLGTLFRYLQGSDPFDHVFFSDDVFWEYRHAPEKAVDQWVIAFPGWQIAGFVGGEGAFTGFSSATKAFLIDG